MVHLQASGGDQAGAASQSVCFGEHHEGEKKILLFFLLSKNYSLIFEDKIPSIGDLNIPASTAALSIGHRAITAARV